MPKQYFLKLLVSLATPLLIMINLTGCYPVNSIENYTSKTEFYNEANSAFEGKEVKVTLLRSDSTFYIKQTVLHNDSISFWPSQEYKIQDFKRSDIKKVEYENKDYDNLCARIELSNGEIFNLEKVTMTKDSLLNCRVLITKKETIPIQAVKNICYKNYWSIPVGFGIGTAAGFVVGGLLLSSVKEKSKNESPSSLGITSFMEGEAAYGGSVYLGAIVGIITGWIVGGRTTWEFSK